MTEELTGPKRAGSRSGRLYAVRPEGAAQVALMIGPPNSTSIEGSRGGSVSVHDQAANAGDARLRGYPLSAGGLATDQRRLHGAVVGSSTGTRGCGVPGRCRERSRMPRPRLDHPLSAARKEDHVDAGLAHFRGGCAAIAAPTGWTGAKVRWRMTSPIRSESNCLPFSSRTSVTSIRILGSSRE